MRKVASRRLPCPCGGQGRKVCVRPLCVHVGACGAAGCCPALVEGRAEFFWCARFCPCVRACWPRLLGAPDSCVLAVHHKMLPCPCGGQGNVSKSEAPRSKLGGSTRYFFSLVFLAPK
ncbi:uncharacterized protein DS421_4g120570 [Arachis hypogaea]|nr:uncharacterized protein DS421_4g120570 [Arachis hypogaea]